MIYKGHSLDSFSAPPAHIVHSSQGSPRRGEGGGGGKYVNRFVSKCFVSFYADPTGNVRSTSITATSVSTAVWRNASASECAKKVSKQAKTKPGKPISAGFSAPEHAKTTPQTRWSTSSCCQKLTSSQNIRKADFKREMFLSAAPFFHHQFIKWKKKQLLKHKSFFKNLG